MTSSKSEHPIASRSIELLSTCALPLLRPAIRCKLHIPETWESCWIVADAVSILRPGIRRLPESHCRRHQPDGGSIRDEDLERSGFGEQSLESKRMTIHDEQVPAGIAIWPR